MIYVSVLLASSTLLLAVCLVYTARFFLKREAEYINRLLKQGGVAPITIERERVVKLADPEIQPASFIDESFFVDEIKEELEQQYPEVARMSHSEARTRYPHDWARMQKRLQLERMPLRAD